MQYSPKIYQELLAESKKIIMMAIPITGSQLINVAGGFLCMAMLASLGHDILAASALIFSTQLSIMLSGMSFLFSTSILTGHAYGAKKYLLAGNYLQQAWAFSLLISAPIMLIFWNMGNLLIVLGQSKEIAAIANIYFHAYIWAVIPALLSTSNMHFGYGIRQKKLILAVSFLSVIVLLLTAYALIFGKLGLPEMGVAGLGIATAIQQTFFFIVTTVVFNYKKNPLPFHLFQFRVHQNVDCLLQMLRVGGPICIQTSAEMLAFLVGGMMIGWLGTSSLAAIQIVNQYYFLIVIPVFSLSQASSILIGQACGAKEHHLIAKISYASAGIVLLASLFILSIFLLLPESLAAFYLDVTDPANRETLRLTILLFAITAFSQMFDSLRKLFTGLLRGLLNTQLPMLISLFTVWVIGIPMSYILAFILQWGVVGYVIGGMSGILTGVIILGSQWYVRVKKSQLIYSERQLA